MPNSTALITGASGFLGSRLCERLLNDGIAVHATSRTARASCHSGLQWWQDDLLDYAKVYRLFEEVRPDVVYHLAGEVTAAPDLSLVLPTFNGLLGTTLNILAAGTAMSCRRIVVTGSLTEPMATNAEPIPSSPYSAAKWSASAYARMFRKLYGTPVVILRPFMTYGPGQRDTKIIPYVINSLICGNVPLVSSGKWAADWVYVDDVIDAFVAAGSKTGIDGHTIDLGSGSTTSVRKVVTMIVNLVDPKIHPKFGAVHDRPDEQLRVADTGAAAALLGWNARTPMEHGLVQTIRWYRERLVDPNA